jgi:antirestriction protein ArdC
MSQKIYEMIFDRIEQAVEKNNLLPWQKPWAGSGIDPQNLVSKKPYRGINPFMLAVQGFACPYWLTYKQAKKLKGSVRKGEKGTPVIFWKWIDKEDQDGSIKRFPILRYYTVFNAVQCDDIDYPKPELKDIPAIESCENIVAGMPNKPKVEHGQTGAFYRPSTDSIGMPDRGHFIDAEKYYSTLFHELTHSTGHDGRLGRHTKEKTNHRFGTKDYSKEELVAEMGAAFLCGKTGIENKTIDNSAAYIKNWMKKLKNNKKWLVHAAAQAQKSTDYILGVTFND